VESAPVAGQLFDNAQHARRQDIWWRGQDARQLGAQEPLSLPHRNAALQQKGADLLDNAGTLADQALPYPVQRLQVELIRGLGRPRAASSVPRAGNTGRDAARGRPAAAVAKQLLAAGRAAGFRVTPGLRE